MAAVTQLGYVGLGVSNVEEWEHFATDVLGLQSNGIDDDGNLSLRMDEYSHRFIIQPTGKEDVQKTHHVNAVILCRRQRR